MKRTPIRKRNRERLKRIRGEHWHGPYHREIGGLPCEIALHRECYGPVVGHHVRPSLRRDAGNEIPLCGAHHAEIHQKGSRFFLDEYGVDVYARAKALKAQVDAE